PPSGGPQPPTPPQSLSAVLRSSPTRVDLSWSTPASGSVSGYNLYRQADGGAFQKLNGSPIAGLTFTDASPPEATLCDQATAVGTNDLESSPSSLACVDAGPGPSPGAIETRIASGADDAEEHSDGSVSLTSSDLEMMTDGTPQHVIGLRFTGVAIPPGATVTRAYLQFVADEPQSQATTLTIRGEPADNAAAFTTAGGSLTARLAAATQAATPWGSLPAWTAGQAGNEQRTPELAGVIQEIVGRAGWRSGNALALFVTGSGHRTAVSYDGAPGSAALLHVELASAAAALPARSPGVKAAELDLAAGPRIAPNPVRRAATLHVVMAHPGPLRVELFDVQGRRV